MKNRIQNFCIVFLIFAALVLGYLTAAENYGLFSPVQTAGPETRRTADPVRPLSVILRGETCLRITDSRLLTAYCEQLRPVLTELFGSAGAFSTVPESAWSDALRESGVLLDYGALLPVTVMAGEGVPAPEWIADSLLLALEGESVGLMIHGENGCFRAETALKTADLSRLLESTGEAVTYLCELPDVPAGLTDHSAVPSHTNLSAAVVCTALCGEDGRYERDRQDLLLTAFGLDSYSARSYTDPEGGRVYLGENGTLRTVPDGTVLYLSAAGMGAEAASAVNAAAAAEQILYRCTEGLNNRLRYCLSGIRTENGVMRVDFDVYLDGCPMIRGDGSRKAACFLFENGHLSRCELRLFGVTDAAADAVTPDLSAEALLMGLGSHAVGRLTPAWVESDGLWQLQWCALPVSGEGSVSIHE